MRVLIVGGGGREHALAWKISQSSHLDKLFIAPGNPGTAQLGKNIGLSESDFAGLASFAREEKIDLVVVGGESPLVGGIADLLQKDGILVFGPTKEGAQLEGSKVFAKKVMDKVGIPTASFKVVESHEDVDAALEQFSAPYVLKAEGLAGGKGVLICQDAHEARENASKLLSGELFGKAGARIVIEEFLEGKELSMLAISDGERWVLMEPSRDHKKVGDDDTGPNTGGMGAYSPVPEVTEELQDEIEKQVIAPVIQYMAESGIPYQGVLYAGLMLTSQGPKVLEFNVRFGDPEIQALLPRLETDLLPYLLGAAEGKLPREPLKWYSQACLCVVVASGGYPGQYNTGYPVFGLEKVDPRIVVFQANTRQENDEILTDGGRVLGVTGLGEDINNARNLVYGEIEKIHFTGMHYRTDLGRR